MQMENQGLSRRYFIKKTVYTSASILGIGYILNACNSPQSDRENNEKTEPENDNTSKNACEDFSNVSETELKKREQFGYVEKTSIPESRCSNCQLWIAPKENQECGGCMLFKGPVYDDGYCTYWAPQT